jgi:hypothetical protein
MRNVLNFILSFLAFLVGALALVAYSEPAVAIVLHDYLKTTNGLMVGLTVSSMFVICPLFAFLRWWQVWRRSREISYTTETGRISVNLIAVEEALTRAIEGEPDVKKATVRVFEDRVKRSIVIEAVVTLWEVSNVTERNRFCQRLLRRRFAELMPEQTVVQVNLNVHRLNQRRNEDRLVKHPTPLVVESVSSEMSPTRGHLNLPYESKDIYQPAPPIGVEMATTEEDLYVGPSYPVVRDDEDEVGQGSSQVYATAPKNKLRKIKPDGKS